jgi:hypothetical protein
MARDFVAIEGSGNAEAEDGGYPSLVSPRVGTPTATRSDAMQLQEEQRTYLLEIVRLEDARTSDNLTMQHFVAPAETYQVLTAQVAMRLLSRVSR